MRLFILGLLSFVLFFTNSCKNGDNAFAKAKKETFSVPFEKFSLDNGLTVILHKDTSDPVAVSYTHLTLPTKA